MQLFFETADPFSMILMILALVFLFGFVGWIIKSFVSAGSQVISETKNFEINRKNLEPEYKQQYDKYCKRAKIELAKFINENFAEDELHSVVSFYVSRDIGYGDRYIGLSKDKKELVCFDYKKPIEYSFKSYNNEIEPPKPHKIERIKRKSLDKILYFKYEENVSYTTTVSGGGANLKGAVAGALIAGAPGAIIGGRQQVTSKTEKHQDATFIVKYTDSPETKHEGKDAKKYYDAYMRVIPKKEYSYVVLNNQKASPSETQQLKTQSQPESSNHYKVVLVHSGENQAQVMVKVREILDIGLVDAKVIIDNCPATITKSATIDYAETLKSEFESVGAFVSIESV